MARKTSVVAVKQNTCRPFIIDVMVFSPESGYKIQVSIERECTTSDDSIWKVVFDLFKKKSSGSGFDQLVHVSYQGKNSSEDKQIQKTLGGVNAKQADVVLDEVFPTSKEFAKKPNAANKRKVAKASKNFVASADL